MDAVEIRGIGARIDASRLSRYQIAVIALCGAVAMIDGFDTQSIALVAPLIALSWHVASSSFGPVFGVGLFGGMIGAMILGMVGDRLGRKPSLLFAVGVFAVTAIATALARNMNELLLARFVSGLGLGGALPCIISIAAEYSPKRNRATAVAMMFCGFPLGASIGGVLSAHLIPIFGWTSVFYAGGLIPLVLLPALAWAMPESISWLLMRNDRARVGRIVARMRWPVSTDDLTIVAPPARALPARSLFTEGRAAGSILLAATIFLSLLLTYFLINWIPIVTVQSGIGIKSAILGVVYLNIGSVFGCVILGRLADWIGLIPVVGWAFLIGALATAAIGQAGHSSPMLLAATFAAGFSAIGAQMCAVALGANFYETALRATGIGWIMGTGRLGAIAGPVLGGLLVGAGILMPMLFVFAGAISLAAGLIVFLMGFLVFKTRQASAARPAGLAATPND